MRAFAFFAIAMSAWAQSPPSFTLTDLGAMGDLGCIATSTGESAKYIAGFCRPNGTVVDSFTSGTGIFTNQAFYYTGGKMTALPANGDALVMPVGVNDSGMVTGLAVPNQQQLDLLNNTDSSASDLQLGFLYQAGSTNLNSGGLPVETWPLAMNDAGQVTGFNINPSTDTAPFLFSAGQKLTLLPGPSFSLGFGISPKGVVAGGELEGVSDNPGGLPGTFSGGKFNSLASIPGLDFAFADSANDSGLAGGVAFNVPGAFESSCDSMNPPIPGFSQLHGVIWNNGTATDLNPLLGTQFSVVTGVNSSGWVTGFRGPSFPLNDAGFLYLLFYPDEPSFDAFLYISGQVYDLNKLTANGAGWSITNASAVTDSGLIVGAAYDSGGVEHAILLTPSSPPPVNGVPASLAITGGNNQAGPANAMLPQPLTVSVTGSSGSGIAGVTVNFSISSGAGTLSAASAQTNSSGTASVTLTLGTTPGTVTVTASIAGSTIAPVTFTETATTNPTCPIGPPSISSVNSATDFGAFSNFASGSYLEVKGANLAIDSRQWATSDFSGSNAPTSLDGSKVSIDSIPGYVSFISGQQINVQAPSDSATGLVPITVTNCAGTSNVFMFQKNAVSPGMLAPASFNIGKQYLVALFAADLAQGTVTYVGNPGLIAGASFRPAHPGDVIIMYGLGFGPVAPATPPGVIASGSTNLAGLSVEFGQTTAMINYAGLYPGFVGLYEFYVMVPDVASGDSQINISVDGTPVPQTLFLTVEQ